MRRFIITARRAQARRRSSVSWSSRGSAWWRRQLRTSSPPRRPKERFNPGRIPRSSIQSPSYKRIVRFERLIKPMTLSSTTVARCVPQRWRSISGTLFRPFLPANWSVSKKKRFTKTGFSSFAISASSRLPKRANQLRGNGAFEKILRNCRGFGRLVSVRPGAWPNGSHNQGGNSYF